MNYAALIFFAAFMNTTARTESHDKLAITCMHSLRDCSRVVHVQSARTTPPPVDVNVILTARTARALGLSDERGDGYVSVPMARAEAIELHDAQPPHSDLWDASEVRIATAYALGQE